MRKFKRFSAKTSYKNKPAPIKQDSNALPYSLDLNEAKIIENYFVDDKGRLKTRKGNTVLVDDPKVGTPQRIYKTGDPDLFIVKINNSIYYVRTNPAGTLQQITTSGLNSFVDDDSVVYKDYTYVGSYCLCHVKDEGFLEHSSVVDFGVGATTITNTTSGGSATIVRHGGSRDFCHVKDLTGSWSSGDSLSDGTRTATFVGFPEAIDQDASASDFMSNIKLSTTHNGLYRLDTNGSARLVITYVNYYNDEAHNNFVLLSKPDLDSTRIPFIEPDDWDTGLDADIRNAIEIPIGHSVTFTSDERYQFINDLLIKDTLIVVGGNDGLRSWNLEWYTTSDDKTFVEVNTIHDDKDVVVKALHADAEGVYMWTNKHLFYTDYIRNERLNFSRENRIKITNNINERLLTMNYDNIQMITDEEDRVLSLFRDGGSGNPIIYVEFDKSTRSTLVYDETKPVAFCRNNRNEIYCLTDDYKICKMFDGNDDDGRTIIGKIVHAKRTNEWSKLFHLRQVRIKLIPDTELNGSTDIVGFDRFLERRDSINYTYTVNSGTDDDFDDVDNVVRSVNMPSLYAYQIKTLIEGQHEVHSITTDEEMTDMRTVGGFNASSLVTGSSISTEDGFLITTEDGDFLFTG